MPEITNLDKLKINVLTKEQFRGAEKDPNQIYLITDEIIDYDFKVLGQVDFVEEFPEGASVLIESQGEVKRCAADGLGGGGGGDSEILVATYGVTTWGEVKAAVDAGKAVVCHSESLWMPLVRESLGGAYDFIAADQPLKLYHIATLNSAGWSFVQKTMPSNVTSSTVSGWGYTKNTGDYTKPEDGIPESDLSLEVQDKLNTGGSGISRQTVKDWGFAEQAEVELAPSPIDPGTWVSGYINYGNGNATSSTINSRTDYINLSGAQRIKFTRNTTTATDNITSGMAFYDASKKYISGIQTKAGAPQLGLEEMETDVPDGAAFARFTCPTANTSDFALYRYGAVATVAARLSERTDEIVALTSAAICKNLIGDDGRYYRIPTLKLGDKLSFSTSDGQKTVVSREIDFYDEELRYLNYYGLGTNNSYRTVTIPQSLVGACYIRLAQGSYGYAQKLQIEMGETVTEYVEHFDTPYQMHYFKGADEVPSFYEAHIAEKETAIRAITETHPVADSFVFLTDFHDNSNSWNSPSLVKHIMKNTGVHFMAFGGDCFNTSYAKDEAKTRMLKVLNAFDGVAPRFNIIGNHEFNDPNNTLPEKRLSNAEIYNIMCQKQSFDYVSTDGVDYAVINRAAKIYYFFMGCNSAADIITGQIEWFCEELRNVPDGYAVIVISHIGLKNIAAPEPRNAYLVNALAAVKNKTAFTYNGKTYTYSENVSVIGVVSGHTHWDADIVYNGINVVSTTCDARGENYELIDGTATKVARPKGTIDDQAFDVVQIDIENRKLILTRIGYGNDRVISF